MARMTFRFFQFPWRSRNQIARDVDTELEFHLSMRVDELVAQGLGTDEANRRARDEFGDLEFTRAYCRDVDDESESAHRTADRLGELRQDAAYALRTLRRSPAFAIVSVAHTGARHRRQHGDLQRRAERPAEAAPVRHAGLAGGTVRNAPRRAEPARRPLGPEPGGLPRATAHAHGDRRVLHPHRHVARGQLRPGDRDHHPGDGEHVRRARRRRLARTNLLERRGHARHRYQGDPLVPFLGDAARRRQRHRRTHHDAVQQAVRRHRHHAARLHARKQRGFLGSVRPQRRPRARRGHAQAARVRMHRAHQARCVHRRGTRRSCGDLRATRRRVSDDQLRPARDDRSPARGHGLQRAGSPWCCCSARRSSSS